MTFGSAAFLPGLAPATPLPPFGFSPSAEPPGQVPPGRSPTGVAASDLRGRILVAEPQAVVALDLQRILRAAGYRVVGPVATAARAEHLIEGDKIDCAILDLDLPRRSATAIADLLARSGIPIVFLSAGSLEALVDRHCRRPVVQKPYTGAELLSAVDLAMSFAADDGTWPTSWPRVLPQL
jgi:CheY-like chemotaxis protein